jgi:hypothetical protein
MAAIILEPGAPVDVWERFPAWLRKDTTEYAAGRIGEVNAGVSGTKGTWQPLRPLYLDQPGYEQLASVSWRLMHLVLEACRRRARTVGELVDVLRVPSADIPLVREDDPLDEELLVSARPDIIYSSGVPKFVEINIDGATGGTHHADLLARRFCQLLRGGAADGWPAFGPPPSAVDARFSVMRSSLRLSDGDFVVIPVFSKGTVPGLEDAKVFQDWLAPMCESGARHGLDTVACSLDDLAAEDDGTISLRGRRVDAVFRLFQPVDQPAGPGLAAVVRAVQSGAVRMHTTESPWVLGDKTTLAWLWADRDRFAQDDRLLVERYVPWTALLSTPGTMDDELLAYARAHRAELVLKPSNGYGGSGVVVGPSASDAEWDAALTGAAHTRHPYVLQRFAEPDCMEMPFSHVGTGAVEHARVPFVVGPYLFGGKASGVLVRHGVPGSGLVLNAHHGALMNSAVLVDGAC